MRLLNQIWCPPTLPGSFVTIITFFDYLHCFTFILDITINNISMWQYPAGLLKLTIYLVISSQCRIKVVQTSDLYNFGVSLTQDDVNIWRFLLVQLKTFITLFPVIRTLTSIILFRKPLDTPRITYNQTKCFFMEIILLKYFSYGCMCTVIWKGLSVLTRTCNHCWLSKCIDTLKCRDIMLHILLRKNYWRSDNRAIPKY